MVGETLLGWRCAPCVFGQATMMTETTKDMKMHEEDSRLPSPTTT